LTPLSDALDVEKCMYEDLIFLCLFLQLNDLENAVMTLALMKANGGARPHWVNSAYQNARPGSSNIMTDYCILVQGEDWVPSMALKIGCGEVVYPVYNSGRRYLILNNTDDLRSQEHLQKAHRREKIWLLMKGNVYDCTKYAKEAPCSEAYILMKYNMLSDYARDYTSDMPSTDPYDVWEDFQERRDP